MFVIKFIIGMLIIEIYFFANYFVQYNFLSNCNVLGKELNMTASVTPFFWFSLNSQRELYTDPTKAVTLQNSLNVSVNNIALVQQMGSEIQQNHLQNKGYASDTYNTQFSNSMQKSVCSLVATNFENYTGVTCEKFISGSTTQGLHTVIVRFEEGLRKVLSQYSNSSSGTGLLKNADL